MATNYELHSKSRSKVSHEDADRPWDRDASQLTRLGKKPVLKVRASSSCLFAGIKYPSEELCMILGSLEMFSTFAIAVLEHTEHPQRNFGFMSLLGFSCTVLVTWEGTLL